MTEGITRRDFLKRVGTSGLALTALCGKSNPLTDGVLRPEMKINIHLGQTQTFFSRNIRYDMKLDRVYHSPEGYDAADLTINGSPVTIYDYNSGGKFWAPQQARRRGLRGGHVIAYQEQVDGNGKVYSLDDFIESEFIIGADTPNDPTDDYMILFVYSGRSPNK